MEWSDATRVNFLFSMHRGSPDSGEQFLARRRTKPIPCERSPWKAYRWRANFMINIQHFSCRLDACESCQLGAQFALHVETFFPWQAQAQIPNGTRTRRSGKRHVWHRRHYFIVRNQGKKGLPPKSRNQINQLHIFIIRAYF